MAYVQKPPKSKRELLNRMLSRDFDGDLRSLGEGAQVSRVNASTLELRFAGVDRTFLLSVHIPREEKSFSSRDEEEDFSAPMPTTRRATRNQ